MAQKPRDAVVNFLSKFTAASRGPPCDSTALVVLVVVGVTIFESA